MQRELLSHPQIGSYSALLLVAFAAAYLLARWNAARIGVERRHIDNLALLIVVTSLFGARFFSWLFYFPSGSSFWTALWMPAGGLVFYGGLVFGIASLLVYCAVAKLTLKDMLDLWAAPAALGLAIGRVGCFLAGCCWGDLCVAPAQLTSLPASAVRWQVHSVPTISSAKFLLAVRFPAGTGAYEQQREMGLIDSNAPRSLPVHPTQIYEAAGALMLSILLQRGFLRRKISGSIFAQLLIGYGLLRFLIEFLRADNPPIYFGLTLSQVMSLLFLFGGMLLLRQRALSATPEVVEACEAKVH